MQKKDLGQRLRALATDDKKRSKAARLRDVFHDVEAALSAGVSRASVLDELKAHGLVMTLATFETTLKRLRQKQGRTTTAPAPTKPEPLPAQPTDPADSELPETGSHNPADLDAIIQDKPNLAALAKLAKRKPK